ncbi:hypothetical protein CLU79DRAFT_301268 [Phycomyces nitens]|nr:hypothetical protein CLU79DRAFT_301268 [Phycomyces nitens]
MTFGYNNEREHQEAEKEAGSILIELSNQQSQRSEVKKTMAISHLLESPLKKEPEWTDPILLLAAAAAVVDTAKKENKEEEDKGRFANMKKENPSIKRNAMHAYITYMIYTDMTHEQMSLGNNARRHHDQPEELQRPFVWGDQNHHL